MSSTLCEVCGKENAGYHYGGICCRSCKRFFASQTNRISEGKKEPVCKCKLKPVFPYDEHKHCNACRLKLCREAKMNRDVDCRGRWGKTFLAGVSQRNGVSQNGVSVNNGSVSPISSAHPISLKRPTPVRLSTDRRRKKQIYRDSSSSSDDDFDIDSDDEQDSDDEDKTNSRRKNQKRLRKRPNRRDITLSDDSCDDLDTHLYGRKQYKRRAVETDEESDKNNHSKPVSRNSKDEEIKRLKNELAASELARQQQEEQSNSDKDWYEERLQSKDDRIAIMEKGKEMMTQNHLKKLQTVEHEMKESEKAKLELIEKKNSEESMKMKKIHEEKNKKKEKELKDLQDENERLRKENEEMKKKRNQ